MSDFGISISGKTEADPAAVDAIAQEAIAKLKALPASTVSLSGWVNLPGGGSVTLSQPADPDAPAEP